MERFAANLFSITFAAVFALVAYSSVAAQPKVINARVLGVDDGNTILIRDFRNEQHKVRLRAIQAPELSEPEGIRARDYLAQLVAGKWVRILNTRYDRDGRFIGEVLLRGRDISLEMVIAGYAKHYWGFGHVQSEEERQLFQAAEKNAKRSKFNIWANK